MIFVMFSYLKELYNLLSVGLLLLLISAVFLPYHAVRAIYLIYLSPLSIIPGSKWAALGE